MLAVVPISRFGEWLCCRRNDSLRGRSAQVMECLAQWTRGPTSPLHVEQCAAFVAPLEMSNQLIFDGERRCFCDSSVHQEHVKLAMILANIIVGSGRVVVGVNEEFEIAKA